MTHTDTHKRHSLSLSLSLFRKGIAAIMGYGKGDTFVHTHTHAMAVVAKKCRRTAWSVFSCFRSHEEM